MGELPTPGKRYQITSLLRVCSQPTVWLGLMVIVYAAFFCILTVQRHRCQLTIANDLGTFDQIFWNVVHGRGMQQTIEVNFPQWGVHPQPIIVLLAPFYLVYPTPETLLVAQSVALALSAVPLYLIAQWEIRCKGLSLLLTAAYLFSPALSLGVAPSL